MYLVRMPLVFIFASTYLNLDLFSISFRAYESCLNILHCYKNEVLILCIKKNNTHWTLRQILTKNINSLKFIFFLSMPNFFTSGPISKGASPYYTGLLPTITSCSS